ncbi:hypothetical protein [Desulforamulus hydrothermalis]|uniref:Uncharacterized protein n=1 Tax=Desulforamulus hydrothermalis Lam5 = DSM 18033 TaxID=1121428 RepID=K8DWU0_9FIRM|nr:hypothetical protein [Desulforamulus hydrothermalis]CCO06932.1 exported hypothetical protein [Desulforamulus hydrothermalis Lam5 = DSM 18033]SHG99231.1 hypothetical protein SAMN02745177_01055 [Desulforamulus hydrothermalis Lam5 = DSM 18033]
MWRWSISGTRSKALAIILILTLTAAGCLYPALYPAQVQAGVVSDVFGLDGMTGKVADDIFDGGCKLAGGPVYNLGKGIYDTLSGTIGMLAGEHTMVGKVAGWSEVVLNAAQTGVIIYTLATGTATLPVLAAVTITVTLGKMAVDNLKNIDKIFSWLKKNLGDAARSFLDVYKPNIYIYSDMDLAVRVRLEPSSYITASSPTYDREQGWQAEVFGGSLNGCNDYLFYEARVPDRGFQREAGYKIRGNNLRHDLCSLMERYGFNARETADFVEYWEKKLSSRQDYVFYPQGTAILDKIMPVVVEPEPISISRLWFLIEKDRGQPCRPIAWPEKVVHSPYAVVEWGGIIGSGE